MENAFTDNKAMDESKIEQLPHQLMQQDAFVMPLLGSSRKRIWSYLSLVFSLFYLAPLVFGSQLNQLTLLVSISIYVAFIVSYLCLIHCRRAFILPLLIMTSLLVYVGLWFTLGALVLVSYCLFVAAYYFSTKQSLIYTVLFLTIALITSLLIHGAILVVIVPLLLTNIGLYVFGTMERKETQHNFTIQESQQAIQQLSMIAERERIGRDLHDLAGHALSSISLKAQLASKLMQKQKYQQAQAEVDQLAELSQTLLSEIRKTVTSMKKRSLFEELDKLNSVLNAKGILLITEIEAHIVATLSSTQESNIVLLVKEAITNVLRHSNADKVELRLVTTNKKTQLTITDNGNGLSDITEGNGLRGMRERAQLLDATIEFSNKIGLTITFTLPAKA